MDFLVKEYPNLKRDDEIEGSKALLGFAFNANTQANGRGASRSSGVAAADRAV